MAYYVIKNRQGTFDDRKQPAGFIALYSIENRFFICESSTTPSGELVVPMPDGIYDSYPFYQFADGQKLRENLYPDLIATVADKDKPGRLVIKYTQAQLDAQLAITKWLALNVWLPDMKRTGAADDATLVKYQREIDAINTPTDIRAYVRANLYYDL